MLPSFPLLCEDPAQQLEMSDSTATVECSTRYQHGFPPGDTQPPADTLHPQASLPAPQIIFGTIWHFGLGGKTWQQKKLFAKANRVYDFNQL